MKRVGNPGSNHQSNNPFEKTSKETTKIQTAKKASKQKSSNQNQTTLKRTSKLTTPQKLLGEVSSERTTVRGIKYIHIVQFKQLLSSK